MLVLGLLLVLGTGAFVAIAVVENFSGGPEYAVEIFGSQIATLNAPGLFLSGVALALIFCLGLAAFASGLKRRRRMNAVLASASESPSAQGEGREPLPSQSGHRRRGRHIFGH
ncbi:hypothetical protein ABZ281_06750 [Streptomyces sp. NPDC006265]|uniref:hypothetical protein n=1 Tax=Streptomyces sp. NPDC006265 TaxID=3156740 RepID=UPI0033AE2797